MRTNSGYFRFIILFLFISCLVFSIPISFTRAANINPVIKAQTPEINSKHSLKPESGTIEDEFKKLNNQTPIDLVYNTEVQFQLDRFLTHRQDDIAVYIGKSEFFFPAIEAMLDSYNLPLELKYMVAIESGLNPMAQSKSGAMGLWQFLYNTAKLFDLQVNSYVDERCDLYKSTQAACRYLNYLYHTFNDWNLVLAAYNGGPGEVRKAIERSGGKTSYWDLRPYLSNQAANYVPAFIAMNYLFNSYQKYGIEPIPYKFAHKNIDSIYISYSLDFIQIGEVINISEEDLTMLNPMYRKKFIPNTEAANVLYLPKDKIKSFFIYEKEILAKQVKSSTYLELLKNSGTTENRQKVVHEVKSGEYYHLIALKYNCTIENIKAWNQISDEPLYEGQKLTLWVAQ